MYGSYCWLVSPREPRINTIQISRVLIQHYRLDHIILKLYIGHPIVDEEHMRTLGRHNV